MCESVRVTLTFLHFFTGKDTEKERVKFWYVILCQSLSGCCQGVVMCWFLFEMYAQFSLISSGVWYIAAYFLWLSARTHQIQCKEADLQWFFSPLRHILSPPRSHLFWLCCVHEWFTQKWVCAWLGTCCALFLSRTILTYTVQFGSNFASLTSDTCFMFRKQRFLKGRVSAWQQHKFNPVS